MFKSSGISQGSNGNYRICISPEMAKRATPVIDKDAHCPPAKVTRNGNQVGFEVSCTYNGVTSVGKGTSTNSGDVITTEMDMTSKMCIRDSRYGRCGAASGGFTSPQSGPMKCISASVWMT